MEDRTVSCVFYDVTHDKCSALSYDHISNSKPCSNCRFHKTAKELKEARDRADEDARKTMYYEKYHGEGLCC